MAIRKDNNRQRATFTFSKITIGLASPDSIWKEVLVRC